MAEKNIERQETIRLEDYLRVVRDRAWVIALAVVVLVLAATYVSLRTTPLYSASARLVYQRTGLDTAISGYTSYYIDYDKDRSIATDVAAIKNSETLAQAVKTQLGTSTSRSAASLMGMVSVGTSTGSDLVNISATSSDPAEAALVANAYAQQFIDYRRNADRAAVASARDDVKNELDGLTDEQLASDYGLMLQEKYQTLRILEAMQDGGFTLMRAAEVPGAPFTPQTKRNIILALVVGLVLGVGLAFLLEYLDKRVKDEKSLERIAGLPVLASVPAVGGKWRMARKGQRYMDVVGFEGSGSVLLESFRTLRSSLQYFDVDDDVHTILITSGLPQEGKTVTTVNLGIALALSGQRVIILESDLRRPMVHEYLGLNNQVGLSTVLAGKCSIARASQLVKMDDLVPAKEREETETGSLSLRKNLYCLPSGPLPPNPAELLGSGRMGQVMEELKKTADYVLVDSAPLLLVSDPLIIAAHVDAVILTARLKASTRGEMEEVRNLLARAGTRTIGMVAGGVKSRHGYYHRRGYGYGYGYRRGSGYGYE
jgi:succinoglycan biosynthesis transport protein ExoP